MKILLFLTGSLGDTLAAVPALHAIRAAYPEARVTLLSDRQVGRKLVAARAVLEGAGLVDDYLAYPVDPSVAGRLLRPLRMAKLLRQLRRARFDLLVYLVRARKGERRIRRDLAFFRFGGIRRIVGARGVTAYPPPASSGTLPGVNRIGDQYLARLAADGLKIPVVGKSDMDISVGDEEAAAVARWLEKEDDDGGRRWLGLGIGGKQDVCLWPLERYLAVGEMLMAKHDLWPVIFGGSENRADAKSLIGHWGRGYNAAGRLNVRQSVSAMSRCCLFVGNDTGTIHMAAAAGTRCVGIYSSHDYPGEWEPYGRGHAVLRTAIECEGCGKKDCPDLGKACILRITPEMVFQCCREILEEGKS